MSDEVPVVAEIPPCPDCGSTERFRKMYVTLCDNCQRVLDDETPPRLLARENDEGGFDVV